MIVPASCTVTYFTIVMAAVSGSTSTAITSAMKPYVLEEFTRSSASTALATVKPNTAVADGAAAAGVRARGDRPHARERVHLVHDGDVARLHAQLAGHDLRDDRLMALTLRRGAEDRDDPAERIDLDGGGVHCAGLRQVLR